MKNFLFALLLTVTMACAQFINFNDLPNTNQDSIPGSSLNWIYTTTETNPDSDFKMTEYDNAGWRAASPYPEDSDMYNSFYLYVNGYNSPHMGYSTWGYLEIDSLNSVIGNSLRYLVTGGKNTNNPNGVGLPVSTKEQYLRYLENDSNPIATGGEVVGHPYLYFVNSSSSSNQYRLDGAVGNNRLNLYMYLPSSVEMGTGGYQKSPPKTISIGYFTDFGGHWYHEYYVQGGGWVHLVVDAHPYTNNTWGADDYPYPSRGIRDLGSTYFDNMYRFYITTRSYEGLSNVPYSVWFDEFSFENDTLTQNNETINSPSILYNDSTNYWEVSFNDKYRNNPNSWATYELRYSFDQITNVNWDSAIQVIIKENSGFTIDQDSTGKFDKNTPYYPGVWAQFNIREDDEDSIYTGKKIYFAIKDVSQQNVNGKTPIAYKKGRDYNAYGSSFDYEGDSAALPYIKRIDYLIPGVSVIDTVDTIPSDPDTTDTLIYIDTIQIFDTTYVNIFDTTNINVLDTTFIDVFDTTHINIFDTTHINVFDTTYVNIFDTTHINVFDTTFIDVFDTTEVFDTTKVIFGNFNLILD